MIMPDPIPTDCFGNVMVNTADNVFEENKEDATSAMIAEATAAAIEAAAVHIDVSAAESAAAIMAVEETPDSTNEVRVRKNENRRKRYREKILEVAEAQFETTEQQQRATTDECKDKEGHTINYDDMVSLGENSQRSYGDQLVTRREKDRLRYANMTPEQREAYNKKRREQYHKQNELSRQKRRERERSRYHALDVQAAKDRNERRAKLERERYQKLTPEELEAKNARRRERATLARQKREAVKSPTAAATASGVATDPLDKSIKTATDATTEASLVTDYTINTIQSKSDYTINTIQSKSVGV